MKEIKLKVPDHKLQSFLDLVQKLGFETSEDVIVSEAHKSLVCERMARYEKNPDRVLDWEEVKKELS